MSLEVIAVVLGLVTAVAGTLVAVRTDLGVHMLIRLLIASAVETGLICVWAWYVRAAFYFGDGLLLFVCVFVFNELCVWAWRDETKRAAGDDRRAAQNDREDAEKERKAVEKIAEDNLKALKEGRDPIVRQLQKQLHVCELYLEKQEPPLLIYDPQHAPKIQEVAPHYHDALRARLGLPPLPKKEEEPPQLAATPPMIAEAPPPAGNGASQK